MRKPDHVEARLKVVLLKKEKITALQALRRFGTIRLAVYIQRLRDKGLKIKTEMIFENGKTFAQYSL